MIEAFAAEATLVGFPNTQFISSEKTYHLIQKGQITELGNENEMNMGRNYYNKDNRCRNGEQ